MMVGTGANRQPLTKIHPVLLGQQKGGSGGGGSSLLAQHRQQHQERRQHHGSQTTTRQQQMQQNSGYGGYGQQNMQYPPQNIYQPPQPQIQSQYGQNNSANYGGPMPPHMGQQQPPPPPQSQYHDSYKQLKPPLPPTDTGTLKKRKRASRWGDKEDRPIVSGPLTLPADMSDEQRTHYLLQFKIEEITVKLRTGELGIPADPLERSPSPEPIYNTEGKRLNTREYRVRKRLEEERHDLIKQAIDEISEYKPPVDYKPPAQKFSDKVFIPAERNPAVNFIGLLIGPRGNTLKRLEKETGCKIIIRGKGSVKEGKVGRIPGQLMPGEDEPLHALITGLSEKEVKKGVEVVTNIVKEGIDCPDAANELRRNQLRELAELNGTLMDEEIIKCKNCGATDHRHWECQEQQNITNQIICHKCGGYGHVAADCRADTDDAAPPLPTFAEKAKMDNEYMSLMAELGVDGPAPPKRSFSEKSESKERSDHLSNDRDRNSRNKRESKWGPPTSYPPKSLMDVNVNSQSRNSTNRAPPLTANSNTNQTSVWSSQHRGQTPNQGQGNNLPPWQQGPPPRGPPPGFGGPSPQPVPAQYPNQQASNWPQPGGWDQVAGQWQQPTTYPNWQPSYGYNPYQPPPNQQYNAPPPPWNQPPPPPPPPPPSS